MKITSIIKLAVLATPLALASCKSTKNVVATKPMTQEMLRTQEILEMVSSNTQKTKFMTSKLKFKVQMGSQEISLTGNLKMKRDDVIRLQLMAFGFVEAARLEFTKDYVLLMDRINKQYLRATYEQVDFLRNSGLNFYSLQALFWNELFQPGVDTLTTAQLQNFDTNISGNDIIISMKKDNMNYKWLANHEGSIRMTNLLYNHRLHGTTQLNWDYTDFKPFEQGSFPTGNTIIFTTANKEIKITMSYNTLGNESEWETRTAISSKYKEVQVDDILRRFMAL